MDSYTVEISPRLYDGSYGPPVDVTSRVKTRSMGVIKRSIDSKEFDVGIYTYNNLTLTLINHDGMFNDEVSLGSVFPNGRDLAIVEIKFYKDDYSTSFKGIIHDEGTVQDLYEVKIDVLSRDSVFRKASVTSGIINNGDLCSTALKKILNNTVINSVLIYKDELINVDFDFTIDDASKINNESFESIVKQLLGASNSVLYINKAGQLLVNGRNESNTDAPLQLVGQYSLEGKPNITKLVKFNNGNHRTFNSVKVNSTVFSHKNYVKDYGYKPKPFTFSFITNPETERKIAERISDEFKTSKYELELEVPSIVGKDVDLLNLVTVDYPKRSFREDGKFLPVCGDALAGDPITPCPRTLGSISISSKMLFKVIEIAERPSDFKISLKLRQVGKEMSDGFFNPELSSLAGIAIAGLSTAKEGGEFCERFNPSVAGAALAGCTRAG